MKVAKKVRGFGYLVVLAVCLSATALAQSGNNVEFVAAVAADRAEVRWQPQVEYGRMILTVAAPDGEVIRKEFEAGAVPSFRLTDGNGSALPDGQYTYELRVIPNFSQETRAALAASREKGNSAEVIRELQRSGQLPTRIMVQSGSFLIEKGEAFTGSLDEGSEPQNGNPPRPEMRSTSTDGIVPNDVVTADDIIVQGSACIGVDCVNGEVFGFDTIRLKENNTRIQFDDTSGAGFPTNNWQIRANSSAGGGASFLAFVDQGAAGNSESGTIVFEVDAGAPANSIKVASTGRVGLRTATPVLDLHIATTDTPAQRLEQTSAGGFTAQTWDIAGNEANFFVRDVTGGSRLPFRIRPGAPTSSIDISALGNVGIGTQAPGFKLDVVSTTAISARIKSPDVAFRLEGNRVGGNNWALQTVDADGRLRVFDDTSGAERVTVLQNGNTGIGTATPAGRLDVNGTIFQRGVLLHADYVFEPAYELESIEDHAAFMWTNRHLPAMGEKKLDEQGREVVELGARMRGMLEELEKAHIYISTLNERITRKDANLAKLEQQNAELAERLARIEALFSASKAENK